MPIYLRLLVWGFCQAMSSLVAISCQWLALLQLPSGTTQQEPLGRAQFRTDRKSSFLLGLTEGLVEHEGLSLISDGQTQNKACQESLAINDP
ncbi:hypothetical protein B0H63DRAFT_57630 [Podospora didyma]|uniref:Uncharacterized protein n=1 Tax=Podospora didyma TaxID=330526 RepID=A0AAE0P7M7_9PEZI|nr:hypothetical protein B0H63DRAFT_57630 [Podospora didyma]